MTPDDEADSVVDDARAGPRPVDGATVLVVDDEAALRDSFERALADAGHEVLTASNGGEAIVAISPAVDVVLLDRRMPGMSGDEVLEHVTEWQTDCRVVMVTAVEPDVDIVDVAFDDYLTKPVDPSELVETVEQLLLFDRYEELLSEYHAKTREHATLAAAFGGSDVEDSERVRALERRREAVYAELEATVAAFSDEEIRQVLRGAYADVS